MFIGATNRKADLDPALRSRFATTIFFGLPDAESRQAHFPRLLGTATLCRTSTFCACSGRSCLLCMQAVFSAWMHVVVEGLLAY